MSNTKLLAEFGSVLAAMILGFLGWFSHRNGPYPTENRELKNELVNVRNILFAILIVLTQIYFKQ